MVNIEFKGVACASIVLALTPITSVKGFGISGNGVPTISSMGTSSNVERRRVMEFSRPSVLKGRMGTIAARSTHHQQIMLVPPGHEMDIMTNSIVHNIISTTSTFIADASESNSAVTEEFGTRNLSYYSTLALYALSFPGLWSTIKRSTAAKLKQKTYVSSGEAAPDGKPLKQQAGEIMAYMKSKNYEVADAGEVITFRGVVARSTSQAFFLTFCTALGLASLALVLQIQFNELELPIIGVPNWFYLVLLSPYAGIYYWKSGDRVDEVKVKLEASDDDMVNEITIQADDEELDRMWRTLDLREKGMVRVEGIL